VPEAAGLAEWPPAGAAAVDISDFYDRFAADGFGYGPSFQGLRAVWQRGDEVFAEVSLAEDDCASAEQFSLHPALLDAALHAIMFVSLEETDRGRLPFSWSGATVVATGATTLRVRLVPTGPESISVAAADAAGAPLASIDELTLRKVTSSTAPARRPTAHPALHRLDWPVLDTAAATSRWAVLGADAFGLFPALPDAVTLDDLDIDAPVDLLAVSIDATDPREATSRVLDVLQRWLNEQRWQAARLVVCTRDAVVVADGDSPEPSASAVWGLVRAAQVENPDRVVLVDLDGAEESRAVLGSAVEAAVAAAEPQLAVRDGIAHVARLARAGTGDTLVPPAGESAWRLGLTAHGPGTLDALTLEPCPEAAAPLGPGEVRIAVRAAGLNFRDVLGTLGMYPGEISSLGREAAGVITEVADDVTTRRVGERVTGMVFGGFGPLARADARTLVPIPPGWSFEQAATAPIAFLTAYYALVDLGGLQAGESVLVHAATGGVGTAAVQIAQHIGAEVFGTTSDGKREVLRAAGLDDAHVASSRTLDFARHFGGVDVVLNALSGEFVDASLGLLGSSGRFLEMGKTDIRDADEIAAARPGVHYHAFDLWDAGAERIGSMLEELAALFAEGTLRPLPVTAWDVRRAPEAFRHVSQARHVGKVVLTVPARWDPNGTVLITGGSGGLGAELARHLAGHHGMRHLLLASRRGPDTPEADKLIAELGDLGSDARVVACDVTDRESVAAMLASVEPDHPLTAVVHTAGVLADGVLASQSPEGLDEVLRPKLDGALYLDELTRESALAGFVLYSSVAGTFGSAGQANYAAANAALDALATSRRAAGLPWLSLAWGPWVPTSGMTSQLDDAEVARITRGGMEPFTVEHGLAAFDAALGLDEPVLLPVKLDTSPPDDGAPVAPLLRGLVQERSRRAASTDPAAPTLIDQLAGLDAEDRAQALVDLVSSQVAGVLGHGSPEEVDPDSAFSELGFDSLTSVELRNRLSAAVGDRLPATLVFDYPTPSELAAMLGQELAGRIGAAASAGSAPAKGNPIEELDRVAASLEAGLSDEDTRAALAERLRTLLAWCETATAGAADQGSDDDLASATADDIFDLIDQELDT
jgi:NADPH:quinone reductase-like Zn-dependent oxidoreductase/acyl carrier protein